MPLKLGKDENESTNRYQDINGWVEIKNNPLSKVGVFSYSGSQISEELDPDTIYQVYRPEEELSDPECIESFRLLPWTDEHMMLGSSADGLMPAEQKGVEGVIGEDVYYESPYLKGNIKVFSEKMGELMENGKIELSIGYRCIYDIVPGIYNGQRYDAIQRKIRGNHVALVSEGRAGPDVAVLDHFKFILDSTEITMQNRKACDLDEEKKKETEDAEGENENEGAVSLKSLHEALQALVKKVDSMHSGASENPAMDDDKDEEKKKEIETKDDDKDDKKDKGAMDAALLKSVVSDFSEFKKNGMKALLSEISKRNELASELSTYVGTFDHAAMDMNEVAAYGVKKLGLTCPKGYEYSTLSGYFSGKKANVTNIQTGLDHAEDCSDQMADYFKGA